MHKIDGPGHVGGQFVGEDAVIGRAPTVVTPEWLNAVQGELVSLVTAAGLALDKANSAQVLAALKVIFGDGPGAVSFFARSTAPVGYLKANGAAISRTAYAALFASIGTTFGVGDGASTFNLPDLRGEFLRGFDDGRGVDVGRVIGSAQAGTRFPSLYVYSYSQNSAILVSHPVSSNATYPSDNFAQNTDSMTSTTDGAYMQTSLTPGGTSGVTGFTSRPRNVALLACIKY